MRQLTTSETYFYFKHRFKSKDNMQVTFNIQAKRNPEMKNKKYLIQSQYGYYKYDDVMEMIKWLEHENNTVLYAQQLIIDLEAIMCNINGCKSKIARLIGSTPQRVHELNFSYDVAVKIINNLENKLKSMSIEAIRDLKREFIKVCE